MYTDCNKKSSASENRHLFNKPDRKHIFSYHLHNNGYCVTIYVTLYQRYFVWRQGLSPIHQSFGTLIPILLSAFLFLPVSVQKSDHIFN